MTRRMESNLDYYSRLERQVEKILRESNIMFLHGIAHHPMRGIDAIRFKTGEARFNYYVPDFVLPEYPYVLIECKDLSTARIRRDWEKKFNAMRELGYSIILVIPNDKDQFAAAESLSDEWMTIAQTEVLPDAILRVSHALTRRFIRLEGGTMKG